MEFNKSRYYIDKAGIGKRRREKQRLSWNYNCLETSNSMSAEQSYKIRIIADETVETVWKSKDQKERIQK